MAEPLVLIVFLVWVSLVAVYGLWAADRERQRASAAERASRDAAERYSQTLVDVARQVAGWRDPAAATTAASMTRAPTVEELAADRAQALSVRRLANHLQQLAAQSGKALDGDEALRIAGDALADQRTVA